jgi:sugar diacid utilization regulator
MARARSLENSVHEGDLRGAASAAPRSTPLELVEAAVAGDDLQSIARAAAVALSCTVAIVLPAFGLSAKWPASATPPEAIAGVQHYAAALVSDPDRPPPPDLTDVVPVRLGDDVVGVVAALAGQTGGAEARPWLDAAAAAAAIAALMHDSSGSDLHHARRAFLQMLEMHAQADPDALLTQARRLGYDLSQGALAISAALDANKSFDLETAAAAALLADVGDQRLLGLVPIAVDGGDSGAGGAEALLAQLRDAGLPAIAAGPRRGPGGLQDALQEAAVLLELVVDDDAMLKAHEETYRLLVGVLIHNPDELLALRTNTVAPLEEYDATHDTELLSTLEAFLAYHGSTTDTAEAMKLHRHTVGYRLARVQEVSGLSPYETEGRERLSLGLKANRIMLAENRRAGRVHPT